MSTANVVTELEKNTVSLTATSTGVNIPDDARFVALATTSADYIVILPPPVVGKIVYITETTNAGYELRSSAPGTIAINGGVEAVTLNAESAIASTTAYVKCVCTSLTTWICNAYADAGTESACTAAAA